MIGGVLGLVSVIYCSVLWQPERQIRLHQLHWLESLEDRHWKSFASDISESYSDRWHHDKNFLLQNTEEVFRQFLFLSITQTPGELLVGDGSATYSVSLRLSGSGGPLGQMAIDRVNSLQGPFTFRWEKQSWKPWDWKLGEANHPKLEIPEL